MNLTNWFGATMFFFCVAILPAILSASLTVWMRNPTFNNLRDYASAVSNRLDKIELRLDGIDIHFEKVEYGFDLLDISARRKEASHE